eukprot:TRINITY_DN9120_c0_g1_i3.p1 TRINITY_DN9120_c0_g1~~TRINITY_DN9120_c0_g1_i3.p1  ORF type:complete len:438 (+),score=73.42 TRINITY_DN9120_c0_g1_i3:96-1409(+)
MVGTGTHAAKGHGHGHHRSHGGHGSDHGHSHDLEQPLLKEGHGHSHGDGGHGGHGGHGHDAHGSCAGHSHDSSHSHDSGHSHDHGHGHGHGHGGKGEDAALEDQERLKKAVYCALFFMLVEIVGGVVSNSLAIITDAAHMLSDVGGFIVSLVALQLSAMEATQAYTFGFKQAEVLGALLSVAIVWALTAVLLWEALPRFIEPQEIDGRTMFFISVLGFAVNLVLMKVLGHGHSHGDDDHGHAHGGDDGGVAVQAAMAHVIGDIVQSFGVCLASLCIWQQPFDIGFVETSTGKVSKWNYADPCCTCLFGVIVLYTTKSTIVRTIETLMGKAPAKIDQDKLSEDLRSIPNVNSMHDLHVWSIGSSDILCTAHIVVDTAAHQGTVLRRAIEIARHLGVGHTTFQMEVEGEMRKESCGGCDDVFPNGQAAHGGHSGHGHSH